MLFRLPARRMDGRTGRFGELMADTTVEKKLLYFILCSVLLHVALFALLLSLPPGTKPQAGEPLMVDLQDLPEILPPPAPMPPVSRKADRFSRVPQEAVPGGGSPADLQGVPPVPPAAVTREPPAQPPRPSGRGAMERSVESSSKGELFRRPERDGKTADAVNLYPSAARLARIEENYREKYGQEVAQGTASFLNTDDILFGSFLRRFENAVYGVWRYPADAARLGIEGVTPVRITFNRRGEIVGRELLQSSGSKILDDEVLRTLSLVGAVGSFPRGYDRETFDLIAFFHYGIVGGAQRSLR